MLSLADQDRNDVLRVALAFAGIVVLLGAVVTASFLPRLREHLFPRTFRGKLRQFFKPIRLADLQLHDKSFPGYDLGSVNRAIDSFLADCCDKVNQVGSCPHGVDLQNLLASSVVDYHAKLRPNSPAYERAPIDVGVEESFISNCLWMCVIKPAAGQAAEKVAVFLRSAAVVSEFEEDMGGNTAPPINLVINIACASRATADRFFSEIESRRKQFNVFRGKVIEPVVAGSGIRTIGFKRIHPVSEKDLILTAQVKQTLHSSIIGFYQHQDSLRKLGVEMKRGILFHSPPGTGKTSISLYLARLLPNFTVCFVSGRRLLYPRELCSMARYLQPTMLVFEDIDLIAAERDSNSIATVLGELMNQIDGCEPNDQVLFIMNTNSMDRIEMAVRDRPGRVDQIIHLPLPDIAARRELLRHFGRAMKISSEHIDRAAAATDGATPAALKEVVKRAAVLALQRGAAVGEADGITVNDADLLLAYEQIEQMRPKKSMSGEIL